MRTMPRMKNSIDAAAFLQRDEGYYNLMEDVLFEEELSTIVGHP